MCSAGPLKRLTQVDPRDTVTVNPQEQSPLTITPKDVPLGTGMADAARGAILNRRERLRIAEEGR